MIAVNGTLVYIREKESKPPQMPKRQQKKQIAGIEPVSPAWEASVLPMNYTCNLKKMMTDLPSSCNSGREI